MFQLQYFQLKKDIHNLRVKKEVNKNEKNLCDLSNYFLDILFNKENSVKKFIKIVLKIRNINELESSLLHFHKIDNQHSEKINKIIKKCYPELLSEIEQNFISSDCYQLWNDNELKYYQCKIFNEARLIFIIWKENENEYTVYPIILDLNHVIYPSENKQHDENKNVKDCKWNFKNKKTEIINNLKKT